MLLHCASLSCFDIGDTDSVLLESYKLLYAFLRCAVLCLLFSACCCVLCCACLCGAVLLCRAVLCCAVLCCAVCVSVLCAMVCFKITTECVAADSGRG